MTGIVRALRTKDISPQMVISSLQEKVDEIKEIYVVTIKKDDYPDFYCSGDLVNLCLAAKLMDNYATKYINGECVEDGHYDD